MIRYSSKHRSTQKEIMDDFQFQGKEMEVLLDDITNINTRLGGNRVTLKGLSKLLEAHHKDELIKIVDLGCGDGEMLRRCADFGMQYGYKFKLIGIDANEFIIDQAKKLSFDYEDISFRKINVFSEEISFSDFDIGLCTLFLHHFNDSEIHKLLSRLTNQLQLGIVVNDLERNRLAFVLYKVYCLFFIKSKTAGLDGLISIARGFKRTELKNIAELLYTPYSLKWSWAFRFQLIIRSRKKKSINER